MSQRRRPPIEESMHDHWKKAVIYRQTKGDRSHYIAHAENNFVPLQRASNLSELSFTSQSRKFVGPVEKSSFPPVFVTGIAEVQNCLNAFVRAPKIDPLLDERIRSAVEN